MKKSTISVSASAPGKLLLFGEHAVVYGYPCIVTAVEQRMTVRVEKNGVNTFHLDAPDLWLSSYTKNIDKLGTENLPKGVRFVEMLYKRFLEKYSQREGIVVTTKSNFSAEFGFGSSSAVTVAFAKALSTLHGLDLSNKELFDLCYQAVLDVQGVGSGFDLAAAIWGGTLYYVSQAKVVEKLKVDKLPLVVGYTGVKADTPTLVRMVQNSRLENPKKINGIFTKISKLVELARHSLESEQWQQLGDLMKQNQVLLRNLKVSIVELEKLIETAEKSGSGGAKLSGAGGGDCMIALVEGRNLRDKVEKSLRQAGGQVMRVGLNAEGVRIEA